MTRPAAEHCGEPGTPIPNNLDLGCASRHQGVQSRFLVDFLRYNDASTIYLVGDIIDGWRLKKSWYWPQAHNDVVQKVLRKVRKGTRVV